MERRKARRGPGGEGDKRVLRTVEWGSAFSVGCGAEVLCSGRGWHAGLGSGDHC